MYIGVNFKTNYAMKSTELRIGNYVYDHDLELCKIVSIHENGRIRVELPNVEDVPLGSFNVNFSKGIPLTEEILLKCGFEDESSQIPKYIIDRTKWKFRIFKNDLGYYTAFSARAGFLIQVKYLHQLQNLYFALTGEELNIEL